MQTYKRVCGGLTELWSVLCTVEDGVVDYITTARLL